MIILSDGRETSPQKPNGCVYTFENDHTYILTVNGYQDYNQVTFGNLIPVRLTIDCILNQDEYDSSKEWLDNWFNQHKLTQFFTQLEILTDKKEAETAQYYLTSLGIYSEVVAPYGVKMTPNPESKNHWLYIRYFKDVIRLLDNFPHVMAEPFHELITNQFKNRFSMFDNQEFKQQISDWAKHVCGLLTTNGIDLSDKLNDPSEFWEDWTYYGLFVSGDLDDYTSLINDLENNPGNFPTTRYDFYRELTGKDVYQIVETTDIILAR